MNKIKAIFFDIDGTLVSFRTHSIPSSTSVALNKLRQKGIKLFIASGRQFGLINNLGQEHFDGYVTINGALTLVDNKIINHTPIPRTDIDAVNQILCSDKKFPCIFVTEKEILSNYTNNDVEEIKQLINFPNIPVGNIKDNTDDVYQLIAFFRKEQEEEIMCKLPNCTTARWHPLFADVIASGVSKVTGIESVCKHFGIKQEEVMAFGDGGNDIEMLQWAGVGVAMGNANDEVKQIADFVTTSVDEDGILNAVQHFFN